MTAISERMPTLFVGHGSPMITLGDNVYTRAWRSLGNSLPRPRAVVCVSAHWYLPATLVTGDSQPATIHDFRGFPAELFEVSYPARGDTALAETIVDLLSPEDVAPDSQWGLDHGTWSVMRHIYPDADVPIVQLSLNQSRDTRWHFELARRLQPLRDDDILIIGSGNLVHNLRAYAWDGQAVEAYDWAERFESRAREWLLAADFGPLVNYEEQGEDAMMSIPTPDHFLPLLYVLAQYRDGDSISFPVEGFDGGSMSMLAVQIG